jgi:hypothetical protein
MELGTVKVGDLDLAAKLEGGNVTLSASVPVKKYVHMLIDKVEEAIPGDQKVHSQSLKAIIDTQLAG